MTDVPVTTVDWRRNVIIQLNAIAAGGGGCNDVILARSDKDTEFTSVLAPGDALVENFSRTTNKCLITELILIAKESIHYRAIFSDQFDDAVGGLTGHISEEDMDKNGFAGEVDLNLPVVGFTIGGATFFYMSVRLSKPIFYDYIPSTGFPNETELVVLLENIDGASTKTAGDPGELVLIIKGCAIPD